jgi:hypothetical protein
MQNYGFFERMLARSLDVFPTLKYTGKNLYQRINYFMFRERGFECLVHPEARLLSPHSWVGCDTTSSDSIFFGYYDKTPWNSKETMIVLHKYRNDDVLDIVGFNKETHEISRLASTKAWNYQQGAMLQWFGDSKIIFNDLVDRKLVSRIIDIETGDEQSIDYPIQTVDSIRKVALTLNYKRLYKLRRQYGYKVPCLNYSEDLSLSDDGIWKIDLQRNECELLISLSELIRYETREEMSDAEHKINHIMYSPNKTRFLFMHRWLSSMGKFSRLYVAENNGKNLKLLFDDRMVSHYSWRDDNTIIVWARTKDKGDQYYVVKLNSMTYEILGENQLNLFGDGHPSYSPNGKWVVTDTYPNRARQRYLLLFNIDKSELITLGRFYSPFKYNWDNRVDLHPRWDRSGNYISIDSCHDGIRKSYIIDVTRIVG